MDPVLLVIISLAFMLAMWANRDQNYGGVSQPSYKRCVSRVTGCMWVQIPPSLLKSLVFCRWHIGQCMPSWNYSSIGRATGF